MNFCIANKDMLRQSSTLLFSIEVIIGFNNMLKKLFNSCFLIKDDMNFPRKVESCMNSSIDAVFIEPISLSNNFLNHLQL